MLIIILPQKRDSGKINTTPECPIINGSLKINPVRELKILVGLGIS
jgi:hypothetical protein